MRDIVVDVMCCVWLVGWLDVDIKVKSSQVTFKKIDVCRVVDMRVIESSLSGR